MNYYDITKPEDKKAAILINGGDKIFAKHVDENGAEPEDDDLNEYEKLISKIEHVYVTSRKIQI